MRTGMTLSWLACAIVIVPAGLYAQGGGGQGADPPPSSAKAAAPIDLTGYWLALVTEDWRVRMFTPLKGDYTSVPLNPAGRKLADAWDPAKDEAAGEQCRSYGAANIMRVPGRLHIAWQDDQTLKLEMDAGTQTRLFYFAAPRAKGGDWQGVSKAAWEYMPAAITSVLGSRVGADTRFGSLKVATTKLKPGYLRTNGVPYSENTVLTEYFDRVEEPDGGSLLVVTTTVEDPAYLRQPFMTSTHFKKQAGAAGWNPTPCLAR